MSFTTVRLPVVYRNGRRVKTETERELERESEDVEVALLSLYSVLGGKLNVKLISPRLEVKGDFKYVVDGKYVKLRGGKGVLLVAIGVTPEGRRAVLDLVLAEEEGSRSYWSLLARVRRKFNLVLVADGVKALDKAITLSGVHVLRQQCVV
ncbi:hypothetical protein IC007_0438 [Sulfuracidifex tepidarius]|uniref:Uncharacterized protein n=1 Tax=Sulfuracidifex tepidarius TaxID=1294262 RepID=A0A510E0B0_9CREN|nr:hypothetical protein IC007_0438 [Sulfuracidifex tepidarius]